MQIKCQLWLAHGHGLLLGVLGPPHQLFLHTLERWLLHQSVEPYLLITHRVPADSNVVTVLSAFNPRGRHLVLRCKCQLPAAVCLYQLFLYHNSELAADGD
jgi:hypothetical protein